MIKSKKSRRDALTVSAARLELIRLRSELNSAYSVFNRISDPEQLDACIFEISALQSRYSLMLRSYKNLSEVKK